MSDQWVEQALSDAIQGALGIVAQEYVQARVTTFAQAAPSHTEAHTSA